MPTTRFVHRCSAWCAALLALAAIVRADAAPNDPIPRRPDAVVHRAPSGLTVVTIPHRAEPGHVSLHLIVHAGSLRETDDQRGLAHFLEHMAFNGSRSYPPGTLAPFFESLGLTFGRHQNGWVSFDSSRYFLDLPRNDDDTVLAALRFFADIGGGLLLDEDEIDAERRVIQEELRARQSPEQRVRDAIILWLLEGSLAAQRHPAGDDQVIAAASRDDLLAYADQWLRPSNMTIVAVGDVSAEQIERLIGEAFAAAPRGERPEPDEIDLPDRDAPRATIITDPELAMCQVQIATLEPGFAPAQTEADLRAALLDQIGAWAFTRRMEAKIDTGEAVFRRVDVEVDDLASLATRAHVAAWGEPGKWREILAQLSRELERARRHGFRQREVDDARRELLARAEGDAAREATLPTADLAREIANAIAAGKPIPSARQRANLLASLLSTVTNDEVSRAFAERFSASAAAYVVAIPTNLDNAPHSPEKVIAVGKGAVGGELAPEAETARPASILAHAPTPGHVAEASLHPATGVLSAWLDNGVRVHHRHTDFRRNVATIRVTLAGGRIQETLATRGLTESALVAWRRPAARSISSTDIRALLVGRDLKISAEAGRDALSISVTGSPADLEAGLQVVHLLLTEPRVEAAPFRQWQEEALESIATRKMQAGRMLYELVPDALYPADDPRARPLEADEVRAIDAADAQAWLDALVATGPVEAAVVGDIDRAYALDLAARYLGSLPPRHRIAPDIYASLRAVERSKGPIEVHARVRSSTPRAVVLSGMYGADAADTAGVRALDMAAQILTTRLFQALRDEEQIVYSIGAVHIPAEAYRGLGLFYAAGPVDGEHAATLAERIEQEFLAFAESGPTESEIAVARTQLINSIEEDQREPQHWASILADSSYRARPLDDIALATEQIRALTADAVRRAFSAAYAPEARFEFVVRPE